MSTRSRIAVKFNDGSVKSVYCHHDGYLSYVGKTLLDFHNSQSLAELIVKYGDMSSLGQITEPLTEFHSFENREKNVSVYYGRDRKETDVDALHYETELDMFNDVVNDNKFFDIEFFYYWNGSEWLVKENQTVYNLDGSKWLELSHDLINPDAELM